MCVIARINEVNHKDWDIEKATMTSTCNRNLYVAEIE